MVVCARPRGELSSLRSGGLLPLALAACFNPTGTDPGDGTTASTGPGTGDASGSTAAPTTGTTALAGTGPDDACSDPSDCPEGAPFCDPDTATCVQCLAALDCPEDAPICDPALHLCRKCDDHGDCPLACDLERGTCFPAGADTKVLVTDPTVVCPPECADVPCCSITQALQQAAKLPHGHFVVQVGDGTDAAAIVLSAVAGLAGRRIAVIGQPPGAIVSAAGFVISFDQSGVVEPARLFVAGLAFVGGDASQGLSCSNAPGLWLDRVRIAGHKVGYGISATACAVQLRRSFVMDNYGGLFATDGARLIVRNVIVGGSTPGSELYLGTAAELDAVYATIVDDSVNVPGALLLCTQAKQLRIDDGLLLGLAGGVESTDCDGVAYVTRSAVSPGLFSTLFDDDVVIAAPRDDIPFVSWDPPRRYLLQGTAGSLAGVGAWQPGYPTIDIDGTERPTVAGAPDYPGADVPDR